MVKGSSVVQKTSVPSSHAKRKSRKHLLENVDEPMVLEPANLVESYIDQSLQILNKDGVLDDLQMLSDITKNLNQIINSLENIYKKDVEVKEEDTQEDSSQKAHQDMTESLMCFSVISSQLESSFDEEREILESLAKWFAKEAQLMEELGEEDHAADSVLPVADKSVLEGASKVSLCVQKLEKLKSCIQNLPGYAPSLVKQDFKKDQDRRRNLSTAVSSHRDPRIMLEDLVKKHGTEDVISMTQIFDEAPAQTFESMNTRILEIVKVFERQTNKLQRISNEQDLLEAKYEKIKNDYRLLAEEKQMMENELKKIKEGESLEVTQLEQVVVQVISKGPFQAQPRYDTVNTNELEKPITKEEEILPAIKDTPVAKPETKSESEKKAPATAAAPDPAVGAPAPAAAPALVAAAPAPAAAPAVAPVPAAAPGPTAAPAPEAEAPAPAAVPARVAPASAPPAARAPAAKGRSRRQSKKSSSAQTKKESDKLKMQEDLLKAQEHVHVLQKEKLILEEKLKRALQEAENANKQLSNLAAFVPVQDTEIVQDLRISHKSAEKGKNGISGIDTKRYSRDIPKAAPKITKSEGREDHTVSSSKSISEADELVHKLLARNRAKQATMKSSGEMEETKESATLPQKKDVTLGKKGATEEKKAEDHGVLSSKLEEKYLFKEQEKIFKPKEALSSMEESPTPAYPSVQENIRYSSKETDEKTTSLLTGKTQQMPTATRASIKSESSLELGPKGLVTAKKTPEVKEGVSLDSSTGQDACGTTDLDSVSLPKIRGDSESRFSLNYQEQLLSKSSSVYKDSPQLISERQKTALSAKPSTQGQDESLPLYENIMLPTTLPSKYQDVAPLKSSLSSHKTPPESRDAEEASLFPVEKIPPLKTQEKMPAVTAPEDKKAARLVFPVTHTENVTWETRSVEKKIFPWSQKEVVDVEDVEERLPLITHMDKTQQASTHSLAEADLSIGKKTSEVLHSMLAKLSPGVEGLQDTEALEDSRIDSIAEDRSDKPSTLLEGLESNLKDLQEALALTDDKASKQSESHGYELKRILTASLETKVKDLQQVEALIADLDIRGSDEEQAYDIPETRRLLLSSLEPTLRDLQMVEADTIIPPESINEHRLKELMNQKKSFLSSLEETSQDLKQAETVVTDQRDTYRFCEEKMQDLTGKRKLLLTSLASNWKDLQQTRNVAPSQPPGTDVGNKVKELIKERETLVAEIEENLKSLQQVENVVISHLLADRLPDRCFGSSSDLFERKSEAPEKQALNGRILEPEHTGLALPLTQERSIEEELLALKKKILLPNLPSTLPAMSVIQSMEKCISKKGTVPEEPSLPTYEREASPPLPPVTPSRAVSKIHFDFSALPALVPEGRFQKPSEMELHKRKTVKKPDVSENKRDSPSPPYQGEWGDLYISGKSYPLGSKMHEAKRR